MKNPLISERANEGQTENVILAENGGLRLTEIQEVKEGKHEERRLILSFGDKTFQLADSKIQREMIKSADTDPITDAIEAIDKLKDLYEIGFMPCFTIENKPEYIDSLLSNGLIPRKTWIRERLLAGTIGRWPYKFEENRILVILVDKTQLTKIKPRFTGPNHAFCGIIGSMSEIEPDSLVIIDLTSGKVLHPPENIPNKFDVIGSEIEETKKDMRLFF